MRTEPRCQVIEMLFALRDFSANIGVQARFTLWPYPRTWSHSGGLDLWTYKSPAGVGERERQGVPIPRNTNQLGCVRVCGSWFRPVWVRLVPRSWFWSRFRGACGVRCCGDISSGCFGRGGTTTGGEGVHVLRDARELVSEVVPWESVCLHQRWWGVGGRPASRWTAPRPSLVRDTSYEIWGCGIWAIQVCSDGVPWCTLDVPRVPSSRLDGGGQEWGAKGKSTAIPLRVTGFAIRASRRGWYVIRARRRGVRRWDEGTGVPVALATAGEAWYVHSLRVQNTFDCVPQIQCWNALHA